MILTPNQLISCLQTLYSAVAGVQSVPFLLAILQQSKPEDMFQLTIKGTLSSSTANYKT